MRCHWTQERVSQNPPNLCNDTTLLSPRRVSVDVGLHKKTRPTYLSRASQRRYGTYLPTYPARAGHYNGSYVHVMSSHHLVVRRTLSHCAAGAGKNRMWADFALFFRARLRFRDSPRSALTYFRSLCVRSSGISPPAASVARAFDQSLVSDVSTMFYRYISYSRYIWLKLRPSVRSWLQSGCCERVFEL